MENINFEEWNGKKTGSQAMLDCIAKIDELSLSVFRDTDENALRENEGDNWFQKRNEIEAAYSKKYVQMLSGIAAHKQLNDDEKTFASKRAYRDSVQRLPGGCNGKLIVDAETAAQKLFPENFEFFKAKIFPLMIQKCEIYGAPNHVKLTAMIADMNQQIVKTRVANNRSAGQ